MIFEAEWRAAAGGRLVEIEAFDSGQLMPARAAAATEPHCRSEVCPRRAKLVFSFATAPIALAPSFVFPSGKADAGYEMVRSGNVFKAKSVFGSKAFGRDDVKR
ncbi:MAG TPA: hypothetical protein VMB83_09285 [Roseiarcus sp.]|nr:hypothetical protein [Roseiarcus sp.]